MGQKILIVDDEPDLVATCVRVLARRGYECVVAHTGRDAIEVIRRERLDLLLTDLALPDVDGLSVLREARVQSPPVSGILMTAYTSPTTISSAYEAGATFYLAKPFSNVSLLETVGRTLGEVSAPAVLDAVPPAAVPRGVQTEADDREALARTRELRTASRQLHDTTELTGVDSEGLQARARRTAGAARKAKDAAERIKRDPPEAQ